MFVLWDYPGRAGQTNLEKVQLQHVPYKTSWSFELSHVVTFKKGYCLCVVRLSCTTRGFCVEHCLNLEPASFDTKV